MRGTRGRRERRNWGAGGLGPQSRTGFCGTGIDIRVGIVAVTTGNRRESVAITVEAFVYVSIAIVIDAVIGWSLRSYRDSSNRLLERAREFRPEAQLPTTDSEPEPRSHRSCFGGALSS